MQLAMKTYNRVLSTRSAEYVEAIEHLPDGAILVVPGAISDLARVFSEEKNIALENIRIDYMEAAPSPKRRRAGYLFLRISASLLTEFLEISETESQTAALRLFRPRIRADAQ